MSQFKVNKPRLPASAVEGFAAKAGEAPKPAPHNVAEAFTAPAIRLEGLDPTAKPTKGLRLDLNPWQLEALRQIAARDERSMQYVLQKLLKSWLPEELAKKG